MGVSTDGIIGFGVLCEEDTLLPWNMEGVYDIEEWWLDVSEYVPEFQPFTKEGDYAEGWSRGDSRFHKHYEDISAWLKEHPVPVEIVNYCMDSAPMYALCVPGTVIRCQRGYPTLFTPGLLSITNEQSSALLSFLEQWEIVSNNDPQWMLMSYWG